VTLARSPTPRCARIALRADKAHTDHLNALAKDRQVEEAEEESSRLSNESYVEFGAAMNACATRGDVKGAERCFSEMKEAGHDPSDLHYCMLIKACTRSIDTEGAEHWFSEMQLAKLDPGVVGYSALIDTYSKSGNMARAHELLESMRDAGLTLPIEAFGSLISGAAKLGKLEDAAGYFRAMTASQIDPTIIQYNQLLQACARSLPKRPDAAEVIFTRIVQAKLDPSPITLNTLTNAIGGHYARRALCRRLGVDEEKVHADWTGKDSQKRAARLRAAQRGSELEEPRDILQANG